MSPAGVLQEFIEIFEGKGWLNKHLRIKYQDKTYRVHCNEQLFFAYRINEYSYLPPGAPGWFVCKVGQDYVFDESGPSYPASTEPSIQDWLTVIANEDFELI